MPFLVVFSATDIRVGWESFNNGGSDLFLQVDQFFCKGFVGKFFCLKNRLAGLFQQGTAIFLGQAEHAQAGSIGLFFRGLKSL